MTAKASIKLPPDWPGESTVLSALTMLRMAGHWTPWLTGYAAAPEHQQQHHYWLLRMRFYQYVHGVNADWANRHGM